MVRKLHRWRQQPLKDQQLIFRNLLRQGASTRFGRDHDFEKIRSYEDFRKAVPVRDYEGLRSYIDRMVAGETDVLWPARPLYYAKTSGTTSGAKFIPISRQSISNHIHTARYALMNYMVCSGNYRIFDGKMIFLSGSPRLDKTNGVLTGRLSGIVNHHIPAWIRGNQLPSWETNCVEDWETKVDKIVEETIRQPMTLISGIPPWVVMYYERLVEKSGKRVGDLFPGFRVFMHGGVNFQPYEQKLGELVGRPVDTLETYPASEGFIAFQDRVDKPGLLLNTASSIFYEFIPAGEVHTDNPTRLSLEEVEPGVNYAIVLNTNAGLWAYLLGDTVRFISREPYRLVVTGRVSHYISAFGEHVISEEVDRAMVTACDKTKARVIDFTVAPQVNPVEGLPYHEWFVEFSKMPEDVDRFARILDENLQEQNSYYRDLITGKVLRPLVVTLLQKDAFRSYMKSRGKLGGQNKLPRLRNDRQIADELKPYIWTGEKA